jgi:endonuclease/exonuclease/phosphatase family metal-dependent hydrolase
VLYAFEWDWCAALTLWPPWFWAAPGLLLAVLASGRRRPRRGGCVVALWVAFLLVFAEEAWWPVRAGRSGPYARFNAMYGRGQAFRVVSVNCCGGQNEAAWEAMVQTPDVVLVQEAPGPEEVERLAVRFFGRRAGWLYGGDTAVIARGACTPGPVEPRVVHPYTWAEVRLTNGLALHAISVHLLPPQLRHDLWRLDTWRSTADLERGRRQQLQELANMIEATPASTPIVLGGDFNLPAYDGILRVLCPRLHDSFRERGIGWGNTVLNELPISRFDQVWLGDQLRSTGTRAIRTRYSDHRLVVCDTVCQAAPPE